MFTENKPTTVLVRLSNHHIEENYTVSHLLVAIGNITDLIPGEGAFGCQPVVWLVDVQTQGVHSQKKICSLFILKHISRVNRSSSVNRDSLRQLCFPETFVNIEIKDSRLTFFNVCLLKNTPAKDGRFVMTHYTQCAGDLFCFSFHKCLRLRYLNYQ